ncbi:MAG: transglycosylase SLT domain-containing protein [Candidatus Aenigmatarchaeota archaeon]
MVNIIVPYEGYVKKTAKNYFVPEHLAIGVAVLENGGGVDKTSRAGCRGIMQLCKDVAKGYGAIRQETIEVSVGKGKKKHTIKKEIWVDCRGNPIINIDAGLHYLSDLYRNDFHDWGFSIQAYHAGPERVK